MWIRVGECKRCGRCCYLQNLLQASVHQHTACNVSASQVREIKCQHLIFDEQGKGVCLLFGKPERPLACSLHPSSPDSLIPDCSYFFIWVDRGEDLLE